MVAEIGHLHEAQEFLVVRDDDELEVGLLLPRPDDVVQRLGQRPDVVAVEVRRRFVERDELWSPATHDADVSRRGSVEQTGAGKVKGEGSWQEIGDVRRS